MTQETLVDRWQRRAKNNPIVAGLIALAAIAALITQLDDVRRRFWPPVAERSEVPQPAPSLRPSAVDKLDTLIVKGKGLRTAFLLTDGAETVDTRLIDWMRDEAPPVVEEVAGLVARVDFEKITGGTDGDPSNVPPSQLATWNDDKKNKIREFDAKAEYLQELQRETERTWHRVR